MAFLKHEEVDRQVEMALVSPSPVAREKFMEYLENRTSQPERKQAEAAPFFGQANQRKQRILPVRTPRV